jgi:tetrahydromethanopterin S-methyltransferase subunit C
VEHFAPYLLKDGLVQKVTKFENNLPEAEEVISALIDSFSEELPREIEVVQILIWLLAFYSPYETSYRDALL